MKKPVNLNKLIFICTISFLIISLTGSNTFNNNYKISKSVINELSVKPSGEKILVWIEFTDKGLNLSSMLSRPETFLTQKAIDRRKKVKPMNALVDYTDIPLNQSYVEDLASSGIEIKNRSKWFNRVSCYASRIQIEQMCDNDFVNRIELVRKFKKDPNDIEFNRSQELQESDNNGSQNNVAYQLNYGTSLTQMEMINAPMAHDSGYYGQGILVANFDAGFDNLSHPVFDSIKARGLRTYDFVNHDTVVADEFGQMGQGWHGTMTLSLIAGYRPGSLISPAFRSQYILAKTENTDSETPLEEDNWLAAAEWADSLGADIITSSLGYLTMDFGSSHSYDWTWMNGDSCLITIGADLAVNKGILICNSAGNEGSNASHNTIIAPSDGDSVICVGSVNSPSKSRSSFSSVGLSVDGRIKPDVCAMGSGNKIAATGEGNTGYSSGSGTSFSCPMTAGACAIILSANPNLTPRQVWQILITTADSASAPSRYRGWGLINTWEAVKMAKTKSLDLTLLIEGLYNSVTDQMVSDTAKVFLRSNLSPYAIADSSAAVLNSSGQATFMFSNLLTGSGYFIQTSHRSGVETWSKTAQSFNSNGLMIYNFTTDSAKAYGNNLHKENLKWTIYNGDVIKNGVVELSDVIAVYNDASNFVTGYVNTDLNGDDLSDLIDVLLDYNNSKNFVSVIKP
ncbi:MAG TPA: S8 family serine peptidase [Ignavibacteria bacterium]|nr:S8 family serine peptidase [Ignavibacteria bacterium]HMR41403.1 S8 family serine peptidase [Ignavibacteria bacterium]